MYGNFCERNITERLRYAPACRSLLPLSLLLLHPRKLNTSNPLLLPVRLPLLPLLRNDPRPLRQLILVRVGLGRSTLAGGALGLLRVPTRSRAVTFPLLALACRRVLVVRLGFVLALRLLRLARLLLCSVAAGDDVCVFDGELDDQALALVFHGFLLRLLALGRLALDLVVDGVAVEPAQAHQRVTVRVVFDETVTSAPACASFLAHLGTLFCLEDHLGLAHDTLPALLTDLLSNDHLFSTTCDFGFAELLALAVVDVLCEADNTLTRQLLEVFRCDRARDVADGQTCQRKVEGGVFLDLLSA
ncbi:hypothetical protein B5807_11221 [Epicoccum nigrum]|uniref:Uncharacterized protein n=1 Tax=Epicoccum nigrum TaxID=105696 RepID=A0A1Y2LK87_EPING|nr:hypothetical protein B5807_11221 [Epicoccum nigrum]